ncbi:MAG: tetratricopeptide repeat protein [Thermoplasmata archaeon]|nr:tetratricopeptide repeat protein [Thermoplasmata archaeon]
MALEPLIEEALALSGDLPTRLKELMSAACELSKGQEGQKLEIAFRHMSQELRAGEDPRMPLADILFTLERYKECVELFEKLAKDTGHVSSWNNLGVVLTKMGDDKKAVEIYRHALDLKPSSPKVWFNIGKAFYRQHKLPEAMSAFLNSTRLDPTNKSAWNNLGVVYRATGRIGQAMKCYRKAAEIDQSYAWAWHNMGVLLLHEGRPRDAERHFLKALEGKPDYEPSKKMVKALRRKSHA